MIQSLRGALALFLTLAILVIPAGATWSIVLTNTKTGEVIVASATCVPNLDLLKLLPVVRVDIGGAAAQSWGDTGAVNRMKIWSGFSQGDRPSKILDTLANTDNLHQFRQYGIVNFKSTPVTFTGSGAGDAKKGVTGVVGDLRYAIQGNVLTAEQVILAAESALLNSAGDMGQRVMAAMEAARALGGDGRCSCSQQAPTSCGAPPASFTKSAHIGFFVIARHGDTDGVCTGPTGCANGNYYLTLNEVAGAGGPDPVLSMASKYTTWRTSLIGHPDHVLSRMTPGASRLVADGQTATTVFIELRDVDDIPLAGGGAAVTLAHAGASLTSLGPVTDYGNGMYSFDVTAGLVSGKDTIEVTVDDGTVQATLYPPLKFSIDPASELHAGEKAISAAAAIEVPFTINFGAWNAGSAYILLASMTGTSPGTPVGAQVLPLNWDQLSIYTLNHPGAPILPGSFGVLDASGRATAHLKAPAGLLSAFVGLHLDWAAVALTQPESISTTVGLNVLP
ncbi:MAG: hypothetical protein ACI9D0_002202 [Bacteroidia bacterium]|jgi:hypothetical protein